MQSKNDEIKPQSYYYLTVNNSKHGECKTADAQIPTIQLDYPD